MCDVCGMCVTCGVCVACSVCVACVLCVAGVSHVLSRVLLHIYSIMQVFDLNL